ncbi:MTRF1L release factor glutamine methyltransferase [Chanos chanos]|uniref:peptide chain release factor N(5)-glutamine methyltransferase n=1 Tax=Chanos chanos TaxID=29144 RepID=A0A6J2VNV7_CHACN|nr:MTRF1L release factor glutamine methyltransferase [Chanos chanos]
MSSLFKRVLNRYIGTAKHQFSRDASLAVGRNLPAVSRMTVKQAARLWEQHFLEHDIPEARLSSQYIIAHVLGAKTLENVEQRRLAEFLTDAQTERVWELCSKRLTRMPVQYVIEEWDFRELTLKMRPPVFIPRPETEELVSLVLQDLQAQPYGGKTGTTGLQCLEVGCGSGAISLSLLHGLPQLRAVAVDRSPEAVSLTRENAMRLGLQDRLHIHQLDVTKDGSEIVETCGVAQVLVSNPPYLFTQDMEILEEEILRFEDHRALDGGGEGLSVIGAILGLAPQLLSEQGRVYLEVDPRHPPLIQEWVEQRTVGLQYVETRCDITERPRFCILQKGEKRRGQ